MLHKETVLPAPAGPLFRAAPYVSFAGYATVPLLIPVLTNFGLPLGSMGDILGGGLILRAVALRGRDPQPAAGLVRRRRARGGRADRDHRHRLRHHPGSDAPLRRLLDDRARRDRAARSRRCAAWLLSAQPDSGRRRAAGRDAARVRALAFAKFFGFIFLGPARSPSVHGPRAETRTRGLRAASLWTLGLVILLLGAAARWEIHALGSGLQGILGSKAATTTLSHPLVLGHVFRNFPVLAPTWLTIVLPYAVSAMLLGRLAGGQRSCSSLAIRPTLELSPLHDARTRPRPRPDSHPRLMFQRIMLTWEGSDLARAAFDVAIDVARRYESEVVAVSVAHSPAHAETRMDRQESVEAARRYLTETLAEIADRARRAGVDLEHQVIEGENHDRALLDHAGEHGFDLIICGHHHTRRAGRLLLHDIADELVREAPTPVLVVGENFAR